jgi:phage tail-like protein
MTAMRALVPGLPTPHPFGPYLPALFQEDRFAVALVSGLDEVLSPLIATLDNLHAYHDPGVAPDDFLAWLGGWVGTELDEEWPEERRRALVRRAVEIYRVRGTAPGLQAHIELVTGGRVEIVETGGVTWSQESGAEIPGQPEPRMTIRVYVDDVSSVDTRALERLVEASKPAHVIHALEIATGG